MCILSILSVFPSLLEEVVGDVVDGLPGRRPAVHVSDFAQTCDHFLLGQEVGQTELYALLVGVLNRAWKQNAHDIQYAHWRFILNTESL